MKILGLHHVAVAVDSLDKFGALFEDLFDLKVSVPETNPQSKVCLSFLNLDNADIELVEPLAADSTVARFIEKRGPGIHHLCLLVDDIDNALEELQAKDVKMIDETPRKGAGGSLVAFIHPDSVGGILIELKQLPSKYDR